MLTALLLAPLAPSHLSTHAVGEATWTVVREREALAVFRWNRDPVKKPEGGR